MRGIAMCPYTDESTKHRQMSLSILKDLGLGRSIIETRIGPELERLVDSILELNGYPFEPRKRLYRCINGILMGFIFGRHFDAKTDPLIRQTYDIMDSIVAAYGPDMEFFPILRLLPRNAKALTWTVDAHK
jgi:hypothetical protein